MIITIDGPSASGKSTAARLLAQKLHFHHLNSGYLYRALGYILVTKYNYTNDTLAQPREQDIEIAKKNLSYEYDVDGRSQVFYAGQNITSYLKDSSTDKTASIVSQSALVREVLTDFQRNYAQEYDIVIDGRDTGSIVFPKAEAKFFLTATLPIRAIRWRYEQMNRGKEISLEEAQKEITERDDRDASRRLSPLVIPLDAIVIDNSDMSQDATVAMMIEIVDSRYHA